MNVGNRGVRVMLIFGQREGLVGIDDIEKMMAHAALLVCGRLGGANVHAAIHLARIRGDDLAAKFLREFDRQCGLANRRGSEDRNE